jgi:hypothetical protein
MEISENLKEIFMGYTMVIIKIRFENHAIILHFPKFTYPY